MGAAVITVTIDNPLAIVGRGYSNEYTVQVDWVSSDAGAGAGALATLWTAAKASWQPALTRLRGFIRSIETAPGLNGDLTTSLPTSYGVTLLDEYGYDVAGGGLAARSAAVAEKIVPSEAIWIDSEITFTLTGAGNALKGRMLIHMGS